MRDRSDTSDTSKILMYYSLEAIVLARKPWREHDRLLTVYSAERGKQTLLAQGARRIEAKMSPSLGPLDRALFSVVRGRAYDRMIGVESLDRFEPIRGNLVKVSLACVLTQLIERMTPDGEREPRLYTLLVESLSYLSTQENGGGSLRLFASILLRAFDILGWRQITVDNLSSEAHRVCEQLRTVSASDLGSVACSQDIGREIIQFLETALRSSFEHLGMEPELPSLRFLKSL